MSKRIPIFHYICFGVLVLSMFLPFKKYDQYTSFNFFSSQTLKEEAVLEAGINIPAAWGLIGFMLAISFIVLISKNLATAIVGLVFSVLYVLYLPFLAFVLTFTLFGSQKNQTLQIGYAIAVVTVLVYFVFIIINLVHVNRERKKTGKAANPVLIDDSDLLDTI